MKEMAIEAAIENLDSVLDFIKRELEEKNVNMKILNNVMIAAEEIFVNIAHYAYAPNTGSVVVRTDALGVNPCNEIIIEFEDSGIPYNPLDKEDPDITAPAEEREVGGLGIFMVKKIMDETEYRYENGKNIFKMIKKIMQ